MIKLFAVFFALIVVFTPSLALAEESGETEKSPLKSARETVEKYREEVEKTRIETKNSIKETRATNKASIEAKLAENRKAIELKRAELKEDLDKIKDERKKKVVENTASRISDRNTRWVSHWNEVLTRLSSILEKIETESAELNNTALNDAISKAKSSLSSSQAKVEAQAAKVYSPSIETESTLGENMRSLIGTFQADVKSVISSLNETRRLVKDASTKLREAKSS